MPRRMESDHKSRANYVPGRQKVQNLSLLLYSSSQPCEGALIIIQISKLRPQEEFIKVDIIDWRTVVLL